MGEWVVKPKWKTDFELYVSNWMLWLLIGEVIALLLFFLLLYLVIKAAIRDGINESKLNDNRLRPAPTSRASELSEKVPPMRAD